jgi:hypothetical protein
MQRAITEIERAIKYHQKRHDEHIEKIQQAQVSIELNQEGAEEELTTIKELTEALQKIQSEEVPF